MTNAIGIDLGGTRIKAAVIDAEGNILHQLFAATDDNEWSAGAAWKKAVAETVKSLKKELNGNLISVGISAPGLPDENNRCIAFMPGRMQGLENFMWKEFLNEPAYVLNDAVAALMAEAKFGVAKNKKNVVMVTLGTGVGGAILIDGKLYQGAFNKAGHIGHTAINDDEDCDVTGMPGSLEECIGNYTVGKRSNGKFASTYELLDAYRNGDQFAKEVWLKSVRRLAIGLSSVSNFVSPEAIILSGGITQAGDDLFEPLKEYMNKYEWRPGGNKVEIMRASYGDLAGAIGVASYAMSKDHS
ncbi:MAG: ROK family protein [Bacteroidota bacterium]